ncbi:hypothetical protein ACNR9Q_10270 [Maribacter sp. X9]|uniref:hypothetical protein n=1 Tax=Maribacter sp. X9 TaxID=3402159 RepID=UPI003AF3A0E8
MDYKGIYDYWFNATIKVSTIRILKELKKAESDDFDFNFIFNKICQNVRDIRKIKYSESIEELLPGINKAFEQRKIYGNNKIEKVFSNEVLDLFQKKNNNDNFNERDYSKIIKKIAISESLDILINRFSNSYMFHEAIYKSEMWKYFTLEEIPGGYRNSKNWKVMHDKLYPQQPKAKIKNFTNEPEKSMSKSSVSYLEENERFYLIHLLTKKHLKLDQVELIRFILTISPVQEPKMFTNKYGNTRLYKISNIGLDYISNTEDQHAFVDQLILKLQNSGLKSVITKLKIIKKSLPKLKG